MNSNRAFKPNMDTSTSSIPPIDGLETSSSDEFKSPNSFYDHQSRVKTSTPLLDGEKNRFGTCGDGDCQAVPEKNGGKLDNCYVNEFLNTTPDQQQHNQNVNINQVNEAPAKDWFGLSAPKFGTLIKNRIFVGGISSQTTERDLSELFSSHGNVKASKIVMDRAGVSKGYGFVTFETEAESEALCNLIMKKEIEPILLHDRRLNVAPAVKKLVGFRSDLPYPVDQALPTTPGFGYYQAFPGQFVYNHQLFTPQNQFQEQFYGQNPPPGFHPQQPHFSGCTITAPAGQSSLPICFVPQSQPYQSYQHQQQLPCFVPQVIPSYSLPAPSWHNPSTATLPQMASQPNNNMQRGYASESSNYYNVISDDTSELGNGFECIQVSMPRKDMRSYNTNSTTFFPRTVAQTKADSNGLLPQSSIHIDTTGSSSEDSLQAYTSNGTTYFGHTTAMTGSLLCD